MTALIAKAWRDHRRTLIGFTIGLIAVEIVYLAVYPAMRDSAADLRAMMERLPEAFREMFGEDISSPAGYLRSQLFGELGPVLFLVVAIGAGSRAIAGEEEQRTLDLLLATPARRAQVLASKAIAMAGVLVTLGVTTCVATLLLGPIFDVHVGVVELASATTMLVLLALAIGSIALAVGASTGRRSVAIAVSTAIAVGMYILNALGIAVEALEPIRPLSLFRWYASPLLLSGGLRPANVAVMLVVVAGAYGVAHLRFTTRDLSS